MLSWSVNLYHSDKLLILFSNHNNSGIESWIKQIKTSEAVEIDKISPKPLKEAGEAILLSFMYIFNLSLHTEMVPNDFKIACVSPIYKDGNKSECGNYTLISGILLLLDFLKNLFTTNYLYLSIMKLFRVNSQVFANNILLKLVNV